MKPTFHDLLSFNAGYADTVGFLALQGLFTAHVTGNFVTLASSLVHGTSGAAAKLLALPVFCATVFAARSIVHFLSLADRTALTSMLVVKFGLLAVAAWLAIAFGPFPDADSAVAILTGMTMVVALAIQNAVHRIHQTGAPPTTLMTGTTTQIMIDLADNAFGAKKPDPAVKAKTGSMMRSVSLFACGCAAAALMFIEVGVSSFIVPAVLAGVALARHLVSPPPLATAQTTKPS